MEKELNIETAKSRCPITNKETEFEEFLQTKRENINTKIIDINSLKDK